MQRPPLSRKYRIVALGGLFGMALLISLAARSRTAEVLTILRTGGGWALLAASLYRLVPVELNAAAWAALLEKRRLGWAVTLWMRWIGEAVNALLPAAQIGGDFARARLLTAGGVPAGEATAAMVADVAVGAFTQVLFTFVGAAALILGAASEAPARAHLGWLVLVIGIGAGFAALLIVVARAGVGRLLTALPLHLNGRLAARLRTGGAAIDWSLGSIRRRPRALLASAAWHLLAWLSQIVETWLVLRLLGQPIGWVAALAMESLAASARGAAFVVPGGIGVQEGALVAVGAAFGVPAPAALALAVVKRARELVVGAPAIVAWVIVERHSIATFWSRRRMKERRRVPREVTSPSLPVVRRAPRLRVGVLVDLFWSPTAGGHVKTWERLAATASEAGEKLDLTVHFLGDREATHPLGPHVRYQFHPPLLSSAQVPFLSDMPGHTDLAPHNPWLTSRLRGYDVIHTTDGTFAAARTAARVSRWHGIPLTSSVHTTTPYYTRVFTAATVTRIAGSGRLSRLLLDRWAVAQAAEAHMQRLLDDHHRRCAFVLASRADDRARLATLLGPERVGLLRRGIERDLFNPGRRDRAWLSTTFQIPPDRRVVISSRPPRRHQERARAGARGPPARRRGGRSAPHLRGARPRSRRGDGAPRRTRHLSGRARAGHTGARLRISGPLCSTGCRRGAVERRHRGDQLRPSAGGGGEQWERPVRRRGQDRARLGPGDAARVGGGAGRAAARPPTDGGDGPRRPRLVARERAQLARGVRERSLARLARGRRAA